MNLTTTFGQMVKTHRHQLELKQDELAEQVSCATITIRRIEANTLRPSLQLAEKLAEVLAIPPDEKDTFIKMARTHPNSINLNENTAYSRRTFLAFLQRQTSFLLLYLPIFLILFVIIVNPNYLFALVAYQRPFVFSRIFPWGWGIILVIVGLLFFIQRILVMSNKKSGLAQGVRSQDLSGLTLIFLTFPAVILIMVAPAVLLVIRNGFLN